MNDTLDTIVLANIKDKNIEASLKEALTGDDGSGLFEPPALSLLAEGISAQMVYDTFAIVAAITIADIFNRSESV